VPFDHQILFRPDWPPVVPGRRIQGEGCNEGKTHFVSP